jgi:hypothetical protein
MHALGVSRDSLYGTHTSHAGCDGVITPEQYPRAAPPPAAHMTLFADIIAKKVGGRYG